MRCEISVSYWKRLLIGRKAGERVYVAVEERERQRTEISSPPPYVPEASTQRERSPLRTYVALVPERNIERLQLGGRRWEGNDREYGRRRIFHLSELVSDRNRLLARLISRLVIRSLGIGIMGFHGVRWEWDIEMKWVWDRV
jgi:hypothetical protein